MEVDAFTDWFYKREELNLAFMIEALNILGKPYEFWVFRTDHRDGQVFYGSSSPSFEHYCDVATVTFGMAIKELRCLKENEKYVLKGLLGLA
jgi:hypothetical protein